MGLRMIGIVVVTLLIVAGIAWIVGNVRVGPQGGDIDEEEGK